MDAPAVLDGTLELALGRRAPFTQLGDWLLLSGVSSDARALYWGLSAHINVTRDDTEVWPSLRTLARILGLKKPENVARYMLELEVVGAIDVIRTTAGLVRRNRYVVHQTPRPGYRGPHSMADWYNANRAAPSETQEQRDQREAEFDAWLDAVREALRQACDRTAKARAAARKAKQPTPTPEPFDPPAVESFRTPDPGGTGRPAASRVSAGRTVPLRQGVRTPVVRGQVPPPLGVEQDQGQPDELPSVLPSVHGTRPTPATPRTEGRTNQSVPVPVPTAAPIASAGVELLMELANRDPRLALAGRALAQQGAIVTGLLASGWPRQLLAATISAPLPRPEDIRTSDAAVVAARIETIPLLPPARHPDQPSAPHRPTVAQETARRTHHECQGRKGECGRPVDRPGALCSACRLPCAAGCGYPATPGRSDGRCRRCAQDPTETPTPPPCTEGCGRPAVYASDQRCHPCHRHAQHPASAPRPW